MTDHEKDRKAIECLTEWVSQPNDINHRIYCECDLSIPWNSLKRVLALAQQALAGEPVGLTDG